MNYAGLNYETRFPRQVEIEQERWERINKIIRMRELGFTYRKISEWFGISVGYVGVILKYYVPKMHRKSPIEKYLQGLPVLSPSEAKRLSISISLLLGTPQLVAEEPRPNYSKFCYCCGRPFS